MSSLELSSADVIAHRLKDEGCRHAFGIPGGEVLSLIEALRRVNIRFHTARHENAAGFMAEGTYHASGAPGIVVGTVGPGAANLTNVLANARQDRIPLIALTGCIDAAQEATYSHQVFDHRAVLGPLCKASFRVPEGAVAAIVDKAVRIALEGRPGPVHLDLPMGVADAPSEVVPWHVAPEPMHAVATGRVKAARLALHKAVRPLAIVGLDGLHQRGAGRIRNSLERTGIPTISTYKGKGIVDEHAPNSLGAAGLSPKADAALVELVRRADVVALVGYDPIEMRAGWRNPFRHDSTVIELAAELDTQYMHRANYSLLGDVATHLEELVDGWQARVLWPQGEVRDARAALNSAFAVAEEWGPAAVVDVVQRVIDDDTRVFIDTGAHRILLSQRLKRSLPGLTHQSSGLCTMGCALPMAIGAGVVETQRKLLAVTGDAGLEMVLGELATARDAQVNLTVLVVDDRSLALIEKKQRSRGLPNIGVDFGPGDDFAGTDYAAIARAFGAQGRVVDSEATLEAALGEALYRGGIDVISARIPRRGYDDRI